MFTFSKTDESLTVLVINNGRSSVYPVTSSHPAWNNILEALKNQDEEKLLNLMSVSNLVETFTEANVTVKDGCVFFKGRQLHGLDVDRLLEYARDGIPFLPLARFLERKTKNPSYRSINEMYKFLEHREMTITPQGTVIGYKGVGNDYYSIMGNTSTIMISGQTNSGGHILNTVGSEIRCDRSCVCDDYRQGCSPGLHIGSLAYAVGWGPKVVTVEFDPADVVSVPDDCECQKLRACAYKVIGEHTTGLVHNITAVNADVTDVEPVDSNDDGFFEVDPADSEDDGFNDDSSDDSSNEEDIQLSEAYDNGYSLGEKDGKAHAARKHFVTDTDDDTLTDMELSYIEGYNDAYRSARYGK